LDEIEFYDRFKIKGNFSLKFVGKLLAIFEWSEFFFLLLFFLLIAFLRIFLLRILKKINQKKISKFNPLIEVGRSQKKKNYFKREKVSKTNSRETPTRLLFTIFSMRKSFSFTKLVIIFDKLKLVFHSEFFLRNGFNFR
jgi:hypothetical protein